MNSWIFIYIFKPHLKYVISAFKVSIDVTPSSYVALQIDVVTYMYADIAD